MEPGDAAQRVLADAGEALHWTVIWDRALRAGYIDPLTQRDARDELVRWLAQAARDGVIEKTSTGTYRAR
jgi:HB1, ASXL, restriction endonuclease HTH domain